MTINGTGVIHMPPTHNDRTCKSPVSVVVEVQDQSDPPLTAVAQFSVVIYKAKLNISVPEGHIKYCFETKVCWVLSL